MRSAALVKRTRFLTAALLAVAALAPRVNAQDLNIVQPIKIIERRLGTDTFQILQFRGSRRPNDRTQRVMLAFTDSSVLEVKFAVFAPNGETFNNNPRYEIAAYELQKMFLD